MPQIPIIMPQLGESIAEATVVTINIADGQSVEADQDIVEVETNKAVMSVTAPCAGTVRRWLIEPQQSYPVGAILGYIDATEAEAKRLGLDVPGESENANGLGAETPGSEVPKGRHVAPTVGGLPVPAHVAGAGYMSPRMKARMQELGLRSADLAGVAGSGAGGRVTIEDFEKFLASLEQNQMSPASAMRIAVADAMRRSWTRPLATVGMPVVLDPLLAHRKNSAVKAGPALYALRALALALAESSAPAGRLIGGRIVHPTAIDIGFAVEVEDGVLVPVLRGVDKTSLSEMAPRYSELVAMARDRKLPASATGGSIATITNFGTFGLTWATPIPLPEQTLVLGLGAGRVVPSWDAGQQKFLPATEANLTLSFDHRVLDGGGAGRLLSRVAELLSKPAEL
jgi:pyruvate/2-oxoglutarate dehydrogenase complex dihydrolipoamide acyltransferase (E2) component